MGAHEPPPPPPPKRRHPRFEVFASVEIHAADETLVLATRNISLGGAYLAADGQDLSEFAVGTTIDVVIFEAVTGVEPALKVAAKIVWRDSEGMGLSWDSEDGRVSRAVSRLIKRVDADQKRK